MSSAIRLPLSVYLLLFAQTINLTMAVLSVTVGALAGLELAPTPGLATIPYGLQFLGVMLFTYVASFLMRQKGRAFVFHVASTFLLVAGVFGFFALQLNRFDLMCFSHFFLGLYIACANFYRFAATDGLDPSMKSRAISLVVCGGVLAALVGPYLATHLRNPFDTYTEFSLCYAVMVLFALLNSLLVVFWEKVSTKVTHVNLGTAHIEATRNDSKWPLVSAVTTGSLGYLVMNLLMILASILMQGLCSFSDSSQAIQWHVLSMFLPSFFTGSLIHRFGHWLVIHTGFVLLATASLMGALLDSTYETVVMELIVLGLGWNFSYVGGSALLTSEAPPLLQQKLQGLNDTAIAFCATLGALMPSIVFSTIGWEKTHYLSFAICVLVLIGNVLVGKNQAKV